MKFHAIGLLLRHILLLVQENTATSGHVVVALVRRKTRQHLPNMRNGVKKMVQKLVSFVFAWFTETEPTVVAFVFCQFF